MSVSQAVSPFLSWFQSPETGRRAEAASALALAYLYGDLDAQELRGAEIALTAALDDPSPVVRRALAEAFAGAEQAPRHIIVALANDQPEVAAIVLSRSPALRDADLVDCVAVADPYAQAAAAIRAELSEPVCDALAAVGGREACVAMSINPGARIAPAAMARLIERFGADAELREALLARRDLPHGLRHELAVAAARALSEFVVRAGWLSAERAERLARESRDKSATIVAAQANGATLDLARHLRRAGHLTPGLLLRALLSGDRAFFASALADLADVATARVQGLMRDPQSAGFAALCERAGLPSALSPALRAAVAASRGFVGAPDGRLSLTIVSAVVDACEAAGGEAMGKAMGLLRRFEAEAALEAARDETLRAAQAEAEEEARARTRRRNRSDAAGAGRCGDARRRRASRLRGFRRR
ncbi:MAG: DUF2336 domain-containing protein [Rhodoblastus sp.]|nr:MAG: DUF2336 domain-containing protein [Rhodoblastus sp.]